MSKKKVENNNILSKKTSRKFIAFAIIFFPLLTCLYIVSIHSDGLINETLSIPILIVAILSFLLLITGIIGVIKHKNEPGKRLKRWLRIGLNIFAIIYVVGGFTITALLYLPISTFRDDLITRAMTTLNHKYLATWFYDEYTISYVLENNQVIESGEDTNTDLVQIQEPNFEQTTFANEFEKEIFTKDKGNDLYKIIDIKRPGLQGKLAVIYDPSKVKLAVSKGVGSSLNSSYGQFVTEMSKDNNAIIAINAGGFYDPDWNSTGGVPHGIVIKDGKLIADNSRAVAVGGLVGFNAENKLVLSRMTSKQALAAGIRDAIDFGPFLIVNGEASFVKGNGGWGEAPRTAIAQRKDGIVLFLAMDGRQAASAGADMNHLCDILLDYGAYNAANMDGGTSTVMTFNHEVITNPRDGAFRAKTRPVPNAWILVE